MNSFIKELNDNRYVFWSFDTPDGSFLDLMRFLYKVDLRNRDETKYVSLKKVHCFFCGVKEVPYCSESLYPKVPRADGEKWRSWNADKYKEYAEYLLEFVKLSERYVVCDENDSFEIIINNGENTIANPIRFFDEYYKIGKVYDFLSFSYGLSSGEIALINILACLYKAIRKRIDPYKIKQESINFIFMIDEADMLLHPEWQRKIISTFVSFLKRYSEVFTMQLIIATHSPIMLSDIPKQNVLFLKNGNEEGECETFAQNIFQLFKESFFIGDTGIGVYAEEKLKEIVDHIHNKDLDDVELKKLIASVGDTFLRNKLNEEYLVYHAGSNDIEKAKTKRIEELETQHMELLKLKNEKENKIKEYLKKIEADCDITEEKSEKVERIPNQMSLDNVRKILEEILK